MILAVLVYFVGTIVYVALMAYDSGYERGWNDAKEASDEIWRA